MKTPFGFTLPEEASTAVVELEAIRDRYLTNRADVPERVVATLGLAHKRMRHERAAELNTPL